MRFILRHLRFTGTDTLNLAFGRGRFAIEFLMCGADSAIAIDLSPWLDEPSPKTGSKSPFELLCSTMSSTIPMAMENRRFDVVCMTDVIDVLPDPERVLKMIARFVRPGGHIILNYDWPLTTHGRAAIARMRRYSDGIMRHRDDWPLIGRSSVAPQSLTKHGFTDSQINASLRRSGFAIQHTMFELAHVASFPIPAPTGRMVIARRVPVPDHRGNGDPFSLRQIRGIGRPPFDGIRRKLLSDLS